MKARPLGRTGLMVPELSLGTSPFGSIYGDVTQEQADGTVEAALEAGITVIDTAPWYGQGLSEEVLGRALRGVDRTSYTLATKCGRYVPGSFDFSAERIRRSIPESLERLGLDHVDLIQCHDIEQADLRQVVDEALPTLRDLRDEGIVTHIGISGYRLDVLERIAIQEEVDSVMTFCTYSLQDRRLAQTAERLKAHGIGVFNASPLHMGALTEAGAPDWHPAHSGALARTRRVAELCREAGTRIETVAMQFALDLSEDTGITSTVVGCSQASDVERNLDVVGTTADPELLAAIWDAFGEWLDVGWDREAPDPAAA